MAMLLSGSADQRYRILQLICWSFLVSLVIYAVIARTLATGGASGMEGIPPIMPWVLLAVAALCLFGGPAIARLMLGNAEAQGKRADRFAAFQQATVVAFACREAAGIMGIVIALLTREWLWAVALCAAAALAMAAGWPTRAAFDRFTNPAAPPPIG